MTPDRNPLTALGRLTIDAPDDATLETAVRELVTTTFTFRQAGVRTDVEGFLAHLRELRSSFENGEITVLDELLDRSTDPARAAIRVTMLMRMKDGSTVEGEAHTFAVLDGHRIDALHDLGRYVETGDDRP